MIIGKGFVWLHFPKCAGMAYQSALHRLLAGWPDVVFDPIDSDRPIWHQTIAEREIHDKTFQLGDRKVICGFRRLPDWLLSRVQYEAGRPLAQPLDPDRVPNLRVKLHLLHPPPPADAGTGLPAAGILLRRNRPIRLLH